MPKTDTLLIACTTVASAEAARRLARIAVEARLAACVQIDGPITSIYRWEGRIEEATEFRLWLKFPSRCHLELQDLVLKNHPYAVPEWLILAPDAVSEKYLNWANQAATSAPFSHL